MRALRWIDVGFYLAFAVYLALHPQHSWRYAIGMAVAVPGFALWIAARLQLGESFSVQAKARRLVTTGLYSRFRHPVYLFGGITIAALFLASGVWWLILGLLLLTPVQLARIRKEEAVLSAAFGAEYQKYRARTWF